MTKNTPLFLEIVIKNDNLATLREGDEKLYSLLERLNQAGWCTDRLAIQTQGFLFVGEK